MIQTQPVHIAANGTLTIAGAEPGTYLASVRPDGTIVLEPAQTLTNAQIAELSKPNRAAFTPNERQARKATVRALLRSNPKVTGTEVQRALNAAGFPVGLRTAYIDLDQARYASEHGTIGGDGHGHEVD
jgi:hypothetical protein